MCVSRTEIFGCYRYVLASNLVLVVPNMGQISESGTSPECKMVSYAVFGHPCMRIKASFCKFTSCSQNGTDALKWDVTRMSYVLIVTRLFSHPCICKK